MASNQWDGIPQTQQAAIRDGSGSDAKVSVKTIPVPRPAPHQILVKINWSGLCASDKCLLRDQWEPYNNDALRMAPASLGIAGHEGAGVVAAVGDDVSAFWKVGDRAGVKWIESTCGVCEMCSNGLDEAHCPSVVHHVNEIPGTFQEYCVTDGRYATRIPDGVADEVAGPIMCGGFSAYAACKRTAVKPGEWLVILGAGGGVGHFALLYAKAMGMRVIAVDIGKEKEDMCRKLGAEEFIDFSNDVVAEVMRITTYGAQGALVAAPAQAAYDLAPFTLRVRGTMVALAIPSDPSVVAGTSAAVILNKRLNIVGSLVGTRRDVDEALDFAARGLVRPVLTKGTLHDVDKFCDLMQAGKILGRVVLKVSA
ncbi:polyketide synthase enoylreductase [Fusarium beomiforme]|uniref:Polyketide synthase enoylreductase n=1 Tax=Fusarium beomiforme TaxID=44412 RepID=A0A9P5DU53_9HYPO|nr:polyketide synthase enoylreductase [Fusarium beomiforme]